MFFATLTCAALVICGLTGEYRSKRPHATQDDCVRVTAQALQIIGEEPRDFKIVCRRVRR